MGTIPHRYIYMKNEVILTAKTVEEAMAQARAQYGSAENELSFEILEMPKKGFLGLGAAPAKVKVTITKALEEVNLSDLVSDLRSMKLTTDRDGIDRPAQKPQESRQKKNSREGQPSSQKNPNHAQNEPKKPQEAKEKSQNQPQQPNSQKPQSQNAQNPQKKSEQKLQQPKAEAKPEQKPQQPKPAKESAVKAEVKEIRTEAAAVKTEKKAELDESNLPAALRRPVQKNNPQPKKQQPKKQPRPQDNRDGETKKKDLLSAVMGVADAPKKADSPAVTVIPTVMKPAAPAVDAPAEEPKTDLSAAVDAALAAIEAETPAPLEFEEEEQAAAPAPEKEEARVEYITPAEMELALQFVNTLLSDMNLEARAQAGEPKETDEAPEGRIPARVEIVGDDTGILIGHHGETLDAIQYLMNLSTSRRSGCGKREFVKILLDVGNYREKREETLRSLARRTAARVVKYKRNIVLEPMNPYERRIIHSEIHNISDVSTHSVGSDENRKIVITYEGADKPKDSGKNRRDRSRRRSDKPERSEKMEKTEKSEKNEKSEKSERPRRERPNKPVRAKSIDDVRIDISEQSDKTFGSITADEGVETDDPIAEIAREAEAGEENLREY